MFVEGADLISENIIHCLFLYLTDLLRNVFHLQLYRAGTMKLVKLVYALVDELFGDNEFILALFEIFLGDGAEIGDVDDSGAESGTDMRIDIGGNRKVDDYLFIGLSVEK